MLRTEHNGIASRGMERCQAKRGRAPVGREESAVWMSEQQSVGQRMCTGARSERTGVRSTHCMRGASAGCVGPLGEATGVRTLGGQGQFAGS